MFSAGIIILVEKVFLQFVAINFHEKALSERLMENRLGLKALDRLSNAHPVPKKAQPYGKSRGHKSVTGSFDFLNGHSKRASTASPLKEEKDVSPVVTTPVSVPSPKASRRRVKKKPVATVIVDQVCVDVLRYYAFDSHK